VDLRRIKDLQLLQTLLEEVEDYAVANGEEETEYDPDMAFETV